MFYCDILNTALAYKTLSYLQSSISSHSTEISFLVIFCLCSGSWRDDSVAKHTSLVPSTNAGMLTTARNFGFREPGDLGHFLHMV